MQSSARVIRLVSEGKDDLKGAIESGMLEADTQRMAQQVMQENAHLRARIEQLTQENAAIMAVNEHYRRMEIESIERGMRAQQAPGRGAAAVMAFSCGGMLVMLATALVMCLCMI